MQSGQLSDLPDVCSSCQHASHSTRPYARPAVQVLRGVSIAEPPAKVPTLADIQPEAGLTADTACELSPAALREGTTASHNATYPAARGSAATGKLVRFVPL